jgi:hypothetical protein
VDLEDKSGDRSEQYCYKSSLSCEEEERLGV